MLSNQKLRFNRKPNIIGKQHASCKSSNGILDKMKSILCKEGALDWNADDRVEDGYKYIVTSKKNQSPLDNGHESDQSSPSKPSSPRMPLQKPSKGNILRKTRKNQQKPPLERTKTKNSKRFKIYGRII